MRWIAVAALAIVVGGACSSDPTLAVSVTHPAGLDVARTVVTVYESESLACTDLEFGKLDAAALEALSVDEVELPGELSGISRTHHKVIVARGYGSDKSLVSAGCAEKDEVIGADAVAITTLTAVVVSVRTPVDANAIDVAVTLTDPTGAAITDARPVTWTAYGPSGSSAANPSNVTSPTDGVWEPTLPTCTVAGVARIHPNPPSSVGGYAVQIRAAWAIEQPQPYTSLATNAFGFTDLGMTPTTEARRWCALRSKGAIHRLVCVDATHLAHDYAITVSGGVATATDMGTQVTLPTVMANGTKTVALISEPATGTDRDVYAITERGFFVPLFGAPAAASTLGGIGSGLDTALVVPACGAAAAKVLLAGGGNVVHQTDARGGADKTFVITAPTSSPITQIALDNAGCVTQLAMSGTPGLAQFATLHAEGLLLGLTGPLATALVNCGGATCAPIAELTRGSGTGFTGGTEPRAVFTSIDATGVVLVQVILGPSGNSIERSRMAALAVPDRVVAGQVDTDTGTDLFWDIANRATGTTFEIGYARKAGDVNLEALSRPIDVDVGDLLASDLDSDGLDDIVIVTTDGVSIVPMGAALPAVAPIADPTCMP